MSLSKQAWQQSLDIINASIQHNFNLELAAGTLPSATFAYYLEQDIHFIRHFGECLQHLSSKAKCEYHPLFSQWSHDCVLAVNALEEKFRPIKGQYNKTGFFAPATVEFNNFLIDNCFNQPIEIAIAAILPCFWVYREVGVHVAQNSINNNPYATWIDKYTSIPYAQNVAKLIDIFDEYGDTADPATMKGMIDAFYKVISYELKFWDDAYNLKIMAIIGEV